MDTPSTRDIVEAVGISRTYAHDIRTGKRDPSRPLAIHIFRKTGWRHGTIAELTDEQINTLETIERWERAA